jgi:NAD(P)-dependent dehydrogenase (short-subunit alcohol dehydrogenase family)
VDTPIFDRLGLDSGQKQQLMDTLHERVPVNRLADPMEMARAALFLASDDSSYVIGSELVADGGWLVA